MLTWNFDINAVTNENETPILLASRNGHKELTSVLLENGADPLISTKAKIPQILKCSSYIIFRNCLQNFRPIFEFMTEQIESFGRGCKKEPT